MMSRIFSFMCLLAVLASGCSGLNLKGETKVVIDPSKFHEDCLKLVPGDVWSYSFKASQPVDFNIHFHHEGKISYPVLKKNTSAEKGKFYPDREDFFCLMWTNLQKEPVHIIYTYTTGIQ
jgi:hypothetical protein